MERCRALGKLRGALGEAAYESRRQALLRELIGGAGDDAMTIEGAAEALNALCAMGFVEGEGELTLWADRLLGTPSAETAERQSLLLPARVNAGAATTPVRARRSAQPGGATSERSLSSVRARAWRLLRSGSLSSGGGAYHLGGGEGETGLI